MVSPIMTVRAKVVNDIATITPSWLIVSCLRCHSLCPFLCRRDTARILFKNFVNRIQCFLDAVSIAGINFALQDLD